MERGVIGKQEWHKLLVLEAQEGRKVYVPQEEKGEVSLRLFEKDVEIPYSYANSRLSAKGVFFPQREVLLRFSKEGVQEAETLTEELLLFGLRPCDARALLCLDKVFAPEGGDFTDPYYDSRRRRALIVSLACEQQGPACFCTAVGGGPYDREGSDILIFDLGERLLLEACSGKGRAYLQSRKDFFTGPGLEAASEAAAAPEHPRFSPDAVRRKLEKSFEDSIWEEKAQSCLGCGACTYLCPTCHCFDMTDEEDGPGTGTRVRSWDSCQYPLFTRHASGHNPRPAKTQRLRQRVMHKFLYAPDSCDTLFCVGCGRCVLYCPVNHDIRELLAELSGQGA
jgi:sulfhydrogenase subunit beta (sulfur reductase)